MKKSAILSLILGFALTIISIFTSASTPQTLEAISLYHYGYPLPYVTLYQKLPASTDAMFVINQLAHSDAGLNVNVILFLINGVILSLLIYVLIKLYIFCVDKRKWLF